MQLVIPYAFIVNPTPKRDEFIEFTNFKANIEAMQVIEKFARVSHRSEDKMNPLSWERMKEVTIPLLEQFKQIYPMLYDDIKPNMRQAENLRLPK